MIVKKDISKLRDYISDRIGDKVKVKVDLGRKRIKENVGVIEKTHNNVFTVKVNDETERRLSYSYKDIITKSVELTMHKES